MSKLTAIAYYKGIPPSNKNLEKPMILNYFCEGVEKIGDIAIRHTGMNALLCDIALIQGFVHDQGKQLPHLQLRKDAIELQKRNNRKSLIVDSSLFLYVNKLNPYHYLRYSFDGVFPTTGFYFDKEVNPDRWLKISKQLNINMKPWRERGNNILICLQRNGGWSMQGVSSIEWMNTTINKIKKFSDRPIVVRTHPGDKKTKEFLKINFKNVSLSENESLTDDLKNAWATVVYNSSPSVASIIEGVPAFITDPNPRNSQSFDVADTDLSLIENPTLRDRNFWIEKISMSHWNFEELKSGEAWSFFKKYI